MQALRQYIVIIAALLCTGVSAQEIEARININRQKVQQSSSTVFESLEKALTEFVNNRNWTNMQFHKNERIQCVFNILVNKYSSTENTFECTLNVQSSRPVYNSVYTTTLFSTQDNNFNFTYQDFDQLEFRSDLIDNELTALMAYYVYLIIGFDCDSFAPLGGTDAFNEAKTIVNNAQSLPSKGWKAFEDDKNRYAIINDLTDSGMEPFRQMQYKYYREGMDTMAENAERGRTAITEALELLKQARENKPLSTLPQLFTEYKSDELLSIYKGHGTAKEKEPIIELLSNINASKNNIWNQMK